ncbi:TonB-dependent receptor domain-containing protein [Microbulbifer sp. 2304DJ12-6]|uniref:TonB-dependent receptor domain-containing protein n=1 Tax=Microbulbifer sp. 2304DJ12-6 TaxID=3233340 RepID=UPI0039AF6338
MKSVGRKQVTLGVIASDYRHSWQKTINPTIKRGLTMKKNLLSVAVKGAIGFTAAAIMVPAMPVFAQQDAEMVEEVVVTGSRIKRADLDSPSPVTVLDREDMKVSGLTDVGDLLQSLPSMSGSPIGTTTNNGGNGSVEIDLRGLGVDRTLTLINGRRTVDGGDYQTIPSAMIERVEILKDGASATYGADAVAGVVNIITRKDFEGVELEVQTADFSEMDSGRQDSVSIVVGQQFDKGNFVFGAEYVTQEEAFQSDAPWDFFQNSYYIYPAGCESNVTSCYAGGSSRIPEGRFAIGDKSYINPGNGLVADDGRLYNYAPINYIQTPYERLNFFVEGNAEITDNVRFFTEVRANNRTSAQQLAPMPYDSRPGFDPAYSGFYDFDGNGTLKSYNGIHQDNYYLSNALDAAGIDNQPASAVRRRVVESNRRFEQDIVQVQGVFGFEGTFNDYDWQISYNRGYRSRTDIDMGQFVGANLQNALGPSADLDGDGTPECYSDISDESTLIEGCVPLNLVGGAGTITDEMLAYVGTNLTDHYVDTQEVLDFSLSGDGFELPGGAMAWAVGGGYWAQARTYSPDSGKTTGAVTGGTGLGADGSLYNANLFAEVLLPAYDNGAQSIDVKGGLRHDSYNRFGSDTTWQIGVDVQLIDALKLRATTGTVFRAPTLEDLFDGQFDNAPTAQDPCAETPLPAGCAQASVQDDNQLPATIGGNEDLQPETGDTFTAGVVWTPSFGDSGDLSITLDYWKIQIEDGISSYGAQYILDQCHRSQDDSFCALITRTGDYAIQDILDIDQNVAEQGAAGVDFETRYTLDTEIGQWEASLLWTHLLERTKVAVPGLDEENLEGRYTDPTAEDGGAYAENKINYSLSWYWNELSVSYRGEYISALEGDVSFVDDLPPGYKQDIDAQLYHDLVASYDFSNGTSISSGITNITNEEPPYIDIGFNAKTDPATYRLFGRGYYLRLSHKF